MTREQLDLAHSRLNVEYTRKSGEINRQKNDVIREKSKRLLAIQMRTAAKRDEIRTRIEMLRNERLKLEKDSKAHEEKSEAIRIQENRIARLKEQAAIERAKVAADAYATRLQLDDDARRLSEWLALEKLRLNETFQQEHENNSLTE